MGYKKISGVHRMGSGAEIYHKNAGTYFLFSEAEDKPGHIMKYLKRELRNKTVLDVGCGNGKYIKELAPVTAHYIGLDYSTDQLHIAKRALQCNSALIRGLGQESGIKPQSVDAAVAIWVLESVRNTNQQASIVGEMQRVLKPHGVIYVIENSGDSEFEHIIKREPDICTTAETRDWLIGNGFHEARAVQTHFLFSSIKDAKDVFTTIWGDSIGSRIVDNRICHNVKIYKKVVP
ncbi:MAG: class I SAM-dependent methyltransferase [Candidatus Woesearchaeota archaeon]